MKKRKKLSVSRGYKRTRLLFSGIREFEKRKKENSMNLQLFLGIQEETYKISQKERSNKQEETGQEQEASIF